MIKTRGLTHIHLMVNDIQRSLGFYKTVFGMEERFWAGDGMVFLNTAGLKRCHHAAPGRSETTNCREWQHPPLWF